MTEQDLFQIHYPNGRMEVWIPLFFPCTYGDARKLYPLIFRYGEELEIKKIEDYLEKYICEKKVQEKALEERLQEEEEGTKRCWEILLELRRVKRMRERAERNVQYLYSGSVRKVKREDTDHE